MPIATVRHGGNVPHYIKDTLPLQPSVNFSVRLVISDDYIRARRFDFHADQRSVNVNHNVIDALTANDNVLKCKC